MWILITVELATLTRQDGKTTTRILPAKEVETLIAAYEKTEAEAESAKKEKQKSWTHNFVFNMWILFFIKFIMQTFSIFVKKLVVLQNLC